MPITTILVADKPAIVIRPNDRKDLLRFLRNGHAYLTKNGSRDGTITYRDANEHEANLWHAGRELHLVWGGDEDQFFGIPLALDPCFTEEFVDD